MVKFKDKTKTVVTIPIVAYQLSSNLKLSFGYEIMIVLENTSTLNLVYSNNSESERNDYYNDCKILEKYCSIQNIK